MWFSSIFTPTLLLHQPKRTTLEKRLVLSTSVFTLFHLSCFFIIESERGSLLALNVSIASHFGFETIKNYKIFVYL